MIKRILKYFYRKTIFKIERYFKKKSMRNNFNDENLTIISSNCIGGCIYSDLNKSFNSPTINCFFFSSSFVKFCANLEYYLNVELQEVSSSKDAGLVDYPVGVLEDVEIHFLHYKSFHEAKVKWEQRRKRVNLDNTVYLMTDRDVNEPSDFDDFLSDKKNKKLIFTVKNIQNNDNYVHCYKEKGSVISPDFTTFRKYEYYIDIVEWLNNAKRR